jgi:hypothetical protein
MLEKVQIVWSHWTEHVKDNLFIIVVIRKFLGPEMTHPQVQGRGQLVVDNW